MKTANRLDKSFGPIGSSAGFFLLVAGVVATFTSMFGLILVILGAFLGFTATYTLIDFDKRKIKFSEKLFGIIQTGKWISIVPGMKIGIKESNVTWTAHSKSNRSIDIYNKDFRLILFDKENTEIMPLKKTDTLDAALVELEMLCSKLKLVRIE